MSQSTFHRRRAITAGATLLAGGLVCPGASVLAQTAAWPSRPVRLVVPFAAGGSTDVLARLLGAHMAQTWGQPVVIDNKTGAGGVIGADLVAKSPPDGYTLLLTITSMIQAAALNPKLPFDPFKDFVAVSQIGYSQSLLLVPAALPVKTVGDLVTLSKTGKGLSFASFGTGTSPHLYGELLNMRAGTRLVHVPYKGASLAINDLISGQVDAVFVDMGSARPQLGTGKVKPLAITGERRASFLPDVPTMAESGYPGFEPNGWFGLFAPAGTPADIVARVTAEAARIVKLPEVAERFAALGVTPLGSTPDQFAAMLRADAPKWARIVREANIRVE
ncbi:MAG: Bug family tripartite tricarboxylate transporter substrate binding protein [Burkholderiaceae bacterium]